MLHGSSSDWDSLRKSLTYYEEQLRLCEIPVSNRALNTDLLCDYCGKRGHVKKDCWKWKREQKEKEAPRGKEDQGGKGPGKTQDTPKGKGDQPKGHPDPKGKGKGKDQKGKPHKKKKPKGKGKHRAMDGEESEPESEAGSATRSQSVMALRLGSWTFSRPDRALSPLGAARFLRGSLRVACHLLRRVIATIFLPRRSMRLLGSVLSMVWTLEICGLLILERRVTSSLVNSSALLVS